MKSAEYSRTSPKFQIPRSKYQRSEGTENKLERLFKKVYSLKHSFKNRLMKSSEYRIDNLLEKVQVPRSKYQGMNEQRINWRNRIKSV